MGLTLSCDMNQQSGISKKKSGQQIIIFTKTNEGIKIWNISWNHKINEAFCYLLVLSTVMMP